MSKLISNFSKAGLTLECQNTVCAETDLHISVSDEVALVVQWITFSLLCQAVDVFGVVSNIVNIICFVKQGFTDPVNVSFFGLAIADIGCVTTLIVSNICFTPAVAAADLPFEPTEFQFLTSGITHTTFTRITCWITALITCERCLCIIAPIKVKGIVTSKRVAIIIICIFSVVIVNMTPFYVVNRLGRKFYPYKNKTLIGIISTENQENVQKVFYLINSVCVPFVAFAIIIASTISLVITLRSKTKWRNKSSISSQADNISMRNQKVAKMAVMISILFITCFTPVCVLFIAMSLEPELSLVGKYRSTVLICAGFGALIESINSSVNIFIYYHMSSRFRATLLLLFGRNVKI